MDKTEEEFYEEMSKTFIATSVEYEIRVAIIDATEIETLDAISGAFATEIATEIATFDAIRENLGD